MKKDFTFEFVVEGERAKAEVEVCYEEKKKDEFVFSATATCKILNRTRWNY